jgi:signal transduction histidine kinase
MRLPSYSTRIMMSYVFLVVLAGILSIGSAFYIHQTVARNQAQIEQDEHVGAGARKLNELADKRAMAAQRFALSGEEPFAKDWLKADREFSRTLTKLKEGEHPPECRDFLQRITLANQATHDSTFRQAALDGGPAGLLSAAQIDAEYRLSREIHAFIAARGARLGQDASAALAQTERALGTALAVSALLLGLAMFMSCYIYRTLSRPLNRLLQAARKIEAGHLDHRVEWNQSDEIGELATAFDQMSAELSRKEFLITRQLKELTSAKRTLEAYSRDLESKNREMEGFIYSVSHDLKAPLIAIQGFLAMFAERFTAGLPKEALFYLDRVQANGKQMQAQIQHLLELSRAGETAGAFTRVDTASLIKQVQTDLELQIKAAGATVRAVGRRPTITAEPVRLKQALINLVDNALHYRQDKKPVEIEIGLVELPEVWRFYVKDNGIGIDPDYQHRVFNMFERLTEGLAKNESGTGVGLAIVKRIAESHGGKVGVESKPDGGSTFYFEIAKELAAKETEKAEV